MRGTRHEAGDPSLRTMKMAVFEIIGQANRFCLLLMSFLIFDHVIIIIRHHVVFMRTEAVGLSAWEKYFFKNILGGTNRCGQQTGFIIDVQKRKTGRNIKLRRFPFHVIFSSWPFRTSASCSS